MRLRIRYSFMVILCLVGLYSCSSFQFRSNYRDTNTLLHETENLQTKPFLKAHLKNGDVCIFTDHWIVDQSTNILSGIGHRYDFNRNSKYSGPVSIPVDSVAIFETNTKIENPEASRVRALAILAGIDAAMSIYCLANPKACFGSCPTFYLNDKSPLSYADAEGFSSAISPSMEYGDIDALDCRHLEGGSFSITMKNEALETHCVNNVGVYAYPVSEGERVYQTPGDEFFLCKKTYPISLAMAPEGNVSSMLDSADRKERFSLSDSVDLNSREEIILEFDHMNSKDSLGLLLYFRQTLMTTYFIYSAIGYMGDEVGDIFSKLEESSTLVNTVKNGIRQQLGDIDVYIWDYSGKRWVRESGFYETGPIAVNKQMMPLPAWVKGPVVKIRLVLYNGLWRLDYAALTEISRRVKPELYAPSAVMNKGQADTSALAALLSPDRHLVTMPGNEFTLLYDLPSNPGNYDLFLYSKGYYLEWMRQHWIQDKDIAKLGQMIRSPQRYLKREASNYKKYEKTMEETFWNSRIDTKTFSGYEK